MSSHPEPNNKFSCDWCSKQFSTVYNKNRHMTNSCTPNKRQKLSESNDLVKCGPCDRLINRQDLKNHQNTRHHKNNCITPLSANIFTVATAFQKRIATYRLIPEEEYVNISDFLENEKEKILELLQKELNKMITLKVNMELHGLYTIESKNLTDIKSFQIPNKIITHGLSLDEILLTFKEEIQHKMEKFAEKDSGWALKHILYLEININKYNPLRASSYIKLPECISRKQAIINVQNNNNKCFGWSIVAALIKPNGPENSPLSYPDFTQVCNFSDIVFPVKLKSIAIFEKNNNISVNVYGLEPVFHNNKNRYKIVGPLYFSKCKHNVHINLLLIDDESGNQHYCVIKDL